MRSFESSKPWRWPSRSLLLAAMVATLGLGAVTCSRLFPSDLAALTLEEQQELASQASAWIRSERDAQRPLAIPLVASELARFEPYFPREILEDVRVLGVDSMPSPRFLGAIRHRGRQILRFDQAIGLALGDTLLLRGAEIPAGSPARRGVLFHELVHAVQYNLLGIEPFVDHYLRSLVEVGYRYPQVVFEHQAFELQHRFITHPNEPFSVAAEVEEMVAGLPP